MNKDELKAKYPDLYAAIFAEGKEAGMKSERERVSAHLKLGEETNSFKTAAQFVREGNSISEDAVQAEYLSARMKNSSLNARNGDDPPDLTPANGEGADDAAMEAAWNMGLSGKDVKGASK